MLYQFWKEWLQALDLEVRKSHLLNCEKNRGCWNCGAPIAYRVVNPNRDNGKKTGQQRHQEQPVRRDMTTPIDYMKWLKTAPWASTWPRGHLYSPPPPSTPWPWSTKNRSWRWAPLTSFTTPDEQTPVRGGIVKKNSWREPNFFWSFSWASGASAFLPLSQRIWRPCLTTFANAIFPCMRQFNSLQIWPPTPYQS